MTTYFNSNFNETLPVTDNTTRFALATNVAQSITVPGNPNQKFQALFSYNATSNVFIGFNVTATSPAAGTNESTEFIEYRPDKRYVTAGQTISIITPDANAYVGVSFRLLPNN